MQPYRHSTHLQIAQGIFFYTHQTQKQECVKSDKQPLDRQKEWTVHGLSDYDLEKNLFGKWKVDTYI